MDNLNALKNEAAVVDAEAEALTAPPAPEVAADAAAGAAPAAEPTLSPIEEARGVIDLAVSLAVPFYSSLDAIYTDDARDRLARAAAPLLAKYGISIGSLFARWKEEIDFAFVALPLVLQTLQAIKAENLRKKLSEKKPKTGGAEVPGRADIAAPGPSGEAVSGPAPLVAGV